MQAQVHNCLSYILENGDEKTVCLESGTLIDLVKWFEDSHSENSYEIMADVGDRITLFKDSIIYIKY